MKTKLIIIASLLTLVTGCRKYDEFVDSRVEPVDYLSGKKYENLVIEVQFVSGFQPDNAAVDHMKNMLAKRLNKTGGISIHYSTIASPGKSSYSVTDIEELEKKYRTQFTGGKTVAAYFLFLDGAYAADAASVKTLGITYDHSSVAIFGKTMKDYSGGIGQPSRYVLEATVMEHEFGHLVGLVNNGTPMVHEHYDGDHPHHCNNTSCLMYYEAETSNVISNLSGGQIPELDQECINDIIANGGK